MYKSPRFNVWGISDHNLFTEAQQVLNEEQKIKVNRMDLNSFIHVFFDFKKERKCKNDKAMCNLKQLVIKLLSSCRLLDAVVGCFPANKNIMRMAFL